MSSAFSLTQYARTRSSSAGLAHSCLLQMRNDHVEVHHIGIFVMHVEQVDLVRELAAIEAALLDQHDVKAVRICVDDARAHATRRTLAAHDQRLDAEPNEMRHQRRAVERTG